VPLTTDCMHTYHVRQSCSLVEQGFPFLLKSGQALHCALSELSSDPIPFQPQYTAV
jgi:hypothetical protein